MPEYDVLLHNSGISVKKENADNPKQMTSIDEEGAMVVNEDYTTGDTVALSCPICESPMVGKILVRSSRHHGKGVQTTHIRVGVVKTSCECPTVIFEEEWVNVR